MKKHIFALLLFSFGLFSTAVAQSKPKTKTKYAFTHVSESSKGKNSRAQFRKENKGVGLIDLHPGSPEKFKTAKSNKNYKFSNSKGFRARPRK